VEVDLGGIAAAAAAVFFYLRLIRAQRVLLRGSEQSDRPRLIRRWPLFVVGLVLVLAGAAAAAGALPRGLAIEAKPWWWVPVALGFAVLTTSI
jgi:hypothetical protein